MGRPFSLISKEREYIPVLLLLLLGFALRSIYTVSLPFGLNQDEASAGYDAWALLNYGTDRCGNELPVLLESWGSGQNALMSYIAVPFTAVFGLCEFSVRLVNVIFGCLTLIVFWLTARLAKGRGFGICALFILTVCPWHIMACRWALEANLLPFFLLLGIFFTMRARENKFFLFGAAVSFGLSLYAYGTAFFFLPVFLLFSVFRLRKTLDPVIFCSSQLLFSVIAVPISLCHLLNATGDAGIKIFGFSIPELTQGRQFATSVFSGGGVSEAIANFSEFLRIFVTQSDSLPFNSIPEGGLFYFWGPTLAVFGLIMSLCTRRDCPVEAPMRDAFFAGLICAFLIAPNINRMNMIWLPVAYFISIPLYFLLIRIRIWSLIPLAGMIACLGIFLNSYKTQFRSSEYFYPGLGAAVSYVEAFDPDRVYMSDYINQPYIFALFYSETPPSEFIATVDYVDPDGAFRQVRSFGRYKFGPAYKANGDFIIVHRSEISNYNVIREFGSFAVCTADSSGN
ncbi:MAG: glycosyltransferase family 39 protein [Oscillospiraceae bacterium]|nr:glycosyltransferase family 39 protein [Oscillospiraceae bacterium]